MRQGVAANARTAVILRIEAEGVGIGLRHAEGLVPVARRVVADVDLLVVDTAGVVLDDAEVVVRLVAVGVADDVLELLGAALVGLALLDDLGDAAALHGGFQTDDRLIAALLGRAGVLARKLEGVLDGFALLTGVATLGDFRVVAQVEEGVGDLAVRHPDVDDRDSGVAHASGHEFGLDDFLNVVFAETLGLSERSGVVLSENTGHGAVKGVYNSKTNMCRILEGNLHGKFRVQCFSLVRNENGIRQRTRRCGCNSGFLGSGRRGRRISGRSGGRIRWGNGG